VSVPTEPVRLKDRMFYGHYETTLKEVITNIPLPSATNFNNIQSLGREKKIASNEELNYWTNCSYPNNNKHSFCSNVWVPTASTAMGI
jgi:hypothetical protein